MWHWLRNLVSCLIQACLILYQLLAACADPSAQAIKDGQLPGIVGPSNEWALHPNADTDVNVSARPRRDEHMKTFVELGMLSRATHGVWSTSGFSCVARWMMGGPVENQFLASLSREGGCHSFQELGGPPMV